ncbi:hypothetical protein [Fodinicola acaciae]|uniref:hypothetical protein n=1 Tax=Fodinicola acaciae TaxID=2681555 RepID=UPI0013D4C216|nr:hypothetical protein [Fodinicola acaciae]
MYAAGWSSAVITTSSPETTSRCTPASCRSSSDCSKTLQHHGFIDAYARCSPGEQAYSWIGRTNDGYRYDYFHVGAALSDRIASCAYLHETREQRLTDHAAVTLTLDVAAVERIDTGDPVADGLF